MNHKKMDNEKLLNLKTNCNKCSRKKSNSCPYLEELVNCNMFNDLKGQRIVNEPLYNRLVSQR